MNPIIISQTIGHIANVFTAKGPKRVFYSILHIFLIALSALFIYFIYYLVTNNGQIMSDKGFIVWIFLWFGVVMCAFAALVTFLQGLVAQICNIIATSISIKHNEDKGANTAALIISVLSFVALGVIIAILLM